MSRCVFSQQQTGRLLFRSECDLGDLVLVHEAGDIRNRWDLPLSASGKPLAFEGALENFAILARPGGLHLACVANRSLEAHVQGLALENLYLTVREPASLRLHGIYDGAGSMADGRAVLLFDVILAQPMLPDPYAANWFVPDAGNVQDRALSITLAWNASTTPALLSRLERRVQFPEIGAAPVHEDAVLRALFDRHLEKSF